MRRVSGDDGGVAVIVALLLPVVLLGFGALVLDVGSLYAERRQLQNGADAAAFAIAQDCATGDCGAPATTAAGLASDNANDARANVKEICGNAVGLTPCADPPAVPTGAGYVRVTAQTGDVNGPGLMPPLLGKALDPTYDGKTVTAMATVAFGGAGNLSAKLPLIISACEYADAYAAVGSPEGLPTAPDLTSPETTIWFHSDSAAGTCPSLTNAGLDLPGGFGWIDVAGCTSETTLGELVPPDTGEAIPGDCITGTGQDKVFAFDSLVNTVIQLPVFGAAGTLQDCPDPSGKCYRVTTYASFYLTGFFFDEKHQHASSVSDLVPCGQPNSCISGYFVQSVADPEASTTVVGAPSGVNVIQLFN